MYCSYLYKIQINNGPTNTYAHLRTFAKYIAGAKNNKKYSTSEICQRMRCIKLFNRDGRPRK